jgi:superfamily I DNA/RNA helicase
MADHETHKKRINEATANIVNSDHPKKILVAGPGAGKTTGFLKLLMSRGFDREKCLIFTFLGVLKKDIEQKLAKLANVFTFHGYCFHLLKSFPSLGIGLTSEFKYFPFLSQTVKEDWEILKGGETPEFMKDFQSAAETDGTKFFIQRADYYDAVSFDDSVFRVYSAIKKGTKIATSYDLVLVDEVQDFNKLEIEFISCMAESYPILIAGDDDQAVYDDFRSADPAYIIDIWGNKDFEQHKLPYCTRCTKVIVDSFHDIVNEAVGQGLLQGRIPKDFEYYPPLKEEDSNKYDKIKIVQTSVYTTKVNYFAEYIKKEIAKIPLDEIRKSKEDDNPTVLIIVSNPYKEQIEKWMVENGFNIDVKKKEDDCPDRKFILRELSKDPNANLWWRVMLTLDKPQFMGKVIKESDEGESLINLLPEEYCKKIFCEIEELKDDEEKTDEEVEKELDKDTPTIKITTFEGAKGLSAYHVFIVGMQNGVLPLNPRDIKDKEVRKLLVAITRAKKQCHLIFTKRPFGIPADPSVFMEWIKNERKEILYIDKNYFK